MDGFWQWYASQLGSAYLLSKARAVVKAQGCIRRAEAGTAGRTEGEVQVAREEAAPVYLRRRVEGGEAMPKVRLCGFENRRRREEQEGERRAVCEYVVRLMPEQLWVELLGGLKG